jgi:hypothetical protein
MLKVLFLDIDGVVLDGQNLRQARNNRYLPPEKIALVKEVCDRAGACVVVSSTWRYSEDTKDALMAAGLALHPDWRTVRAKVVGSLYLAEGRGSEIKEWLDRHPETSAYAIVDDDSDMLREQLPRFVKTQFEEGITPGHVSALVRMLNPA